MRRVLPARLPADFHPRPRAHAGACQDATCKTDGRVPKQRCLAPVGAAILNWFGSSGSCSPVCEEAVFSSSEDRIRASAASAGVAGVGLAKRPIVLKKPLSRDLLPSGRPPKHHGLAGRITASRFPSDRRPRREPLLNISRPPVSTAHREGTCAIPGKVCSTYGQGVLSGYAEPDQDGRVRCRLSRGVRRSFSRALDGSYAGGLREPVRLLKHNGVRSGAAVLGGMLAAAVSTLEPAFTHSPVLVVPVPRYKGKPQRGFKQAELIARDALKTPFGGQLRLRTDILLRTRDPHSQMGLASHQGRENIGGVFAVARAEEVTGRQILLVDDVYTTGTTVTECAKVLRRSGAVRVWVATVARTLKLASKCAEIAQRDVEESALASAAGSRV